MKSGLGKIFLKFLHALTMSFLLLIFDQKYKFSNKTNMVSAWRNFKNIIFSLKMMMKSGLEFIFFKFLHAGNYFPLLHKIPKITNKVIKVTIFSYGGIFQITFHHHFQARNTKISPIFHFDRGHNGRICHILCVKAKTSVKAQIGIQIH